MTFLADVIIARRFDYVLQVKRAEQNDLGIVVSQTLCGYHLDVILRFMGNVVFRKYMMWHLLAAMAGGGDAGLSRGFVESFPLIYRTSTPYVDWHNL